MMLQRVFVREKVYVCRCNSCSEIDLNPNVITKVEVHMNGWMNKQTLVHMKWLSCDFL